MVNISRWIVERREESLKWTGVLCPHKENLWIFFRSISRSWIVQQCPSGKFEVLSHLFAEVDLKAKSCSCYQCQVRGFPCAHAVAVIIHKCPTVYNVMEECFFTKTYRRCYSYDIHAIQETEKFEFQPTSENSEKISPPRSWIGNPVGPRKKESHHSLSSQRRSPRLLVLDVVML